MAQNKIKSNQLDIEDLNGKLLPKSVSGQDKTKGRKKIRLKKKQKSAKNSKKVIS